MAWTLEPNTNDGYPHNANTRYGNPGLVTPYPDGMWRIQSGVNDGYPHKLEVPLCIPGLHPPLPEYGWKMDGVTNDGYPFRHMKKVLAVELPDIQKLPRVYASTNTEFTSNGLAALMPTSGKITEELNGQYELEMTIPIHEQSGWQYAIEFNVIKVQGQPFRIYSKKTSMTERTVYARHIFYDLNGHFILSAHPTELNGQEALEWIMDHTYTNRGVAGTAPKPPFRVHSDITETRTAYYEKMSPTAALLGADNCFVNRWGGELRRDGYDIYINEHRGKQDAFRLRHGVNMLAVEESIDCSDYTPCVYWEATIRGVENAARGVAAYRQLTLPVQPMTFLKVTVDESITDDKEATNDALRQVQEYVAANCMPQVNYRVDVVDLRHMELYKDFVGLAAFNVGDIGTVYSEELGIWTTQQIVKQVMDAITGQVQSIELGSLRKSIVASTGKTVGTYQFEQQRAEEAAKNTYGYLGTMLYTYERLKNTTYAELAGKVMVKYD